MISLSVGSHSAGRRSLAAILLIAALALLLGASTARATSGDLDLSFSGDGKLTTDFRADPTVDSDDKANRVAVQPDGKTVVAGTTDRGGSSKDWVVARYNQDGSLDSSFDGDGKATVDFSGTGYTGYERTLAQVLIQSSDGNIVLVGTTQKVSSGSYGPVQQALARLNPDGSLDTTFGGGDGKVATDVPIGITSVAADPARGAAFAPDGKIVVAGSKRPSSGGVSEFAVDRYTADGSLDPSFSGDGKQTLKFPTNDAVATTVAVQPDGKIVVGGWWVKSQQYDEHDFALARFNSNGSVDTAFGSNGTGTTTTAFESGSGYADRPFAYAREDGDQVILQPDGKIVLGGTTNQAGYLDIAFARYTPDGTLDTSFAGDGTRRIGADCRDDPGCSETRFRDVQNFGGFALQPDGKLVVAADPVAGDPENPVPTFVSYFALARLNPDGSFDYSFAYGRREGYTDYSGYVPPSPDTGGTTLMAFDRTAYQFVRGMTLDPNGKIVLVGDTDINKDYNGPKNFAVARFESRDTPPPAPDPAPPAPDPAPPAPDPAPPAPDPAPGAIDTTPPAVSGYGITNNPFMVAGGSTPTFANAAVRKGTTFRYTLSEASTVRIVIFQRVVGRRQGRRCVTATVRLRKRAKCTRLVRRGTLTRKSKRGANRVTFSGRIGTRALKPGRYRAKLTATDQAKNASRPSTISFTIVRR